MRGKSKNFEGQSLTRRLVAKDAEEKSLYEGKNLKEDCCE